MTRERGRRKSTRRRNLSDLSLSFIFMAALASWEEGANPQRTGSGIKS